jgi:excinuclease ABC subunit C
MTTSSLESVQGIGDRSVEKLFKRFKSIEGIKKATTEELSEVVGLARARLIKEHIQKPGN